MQFWDKVIIIDIKQCFPINKNFFLDAENGVWLADETVGDNEIFPDADNVSLIFPVEKVKLDWKEARKMVWCNVHGKYEFWGRKGDIYCKLKKRCCFLNEVPHDRAMFLASGLWRWLLIQEKPDAEIQIIAEWLRVKWKKKFIFTKMRSIFVPYVIKPYRVGYKINLQQKKLVEQGLFGRKCWDYIPAEIAKSLIDIMTMDLTKIYGHYVLIPQFLKKSGMYINDLYCILNFPNDVHIGFLQKFLGKEYFTKNCLDGASEHYTAVCKYLDIKPPDGIRKEYLKNPYAIVIYFWLIRLGFQNINAIRLFFCDGIMFRTYFSDAYFDPKYRTVYRFYLPCNYSKIDFAFYVRWMLKNGKSEMQLARQITKILTKGWEIWHDDILRMFHEYYPLLADETKKLVKRRCLSSEVHDALAHESYAINMQQIIVEYKSPIILQLNENFAGLKFHVVTDTTELPIIGRHLSNCVTSYAKKIVNKECLIVTASDEADYRICMEIRLEKKNEDGLVEKLKLVQCRGKYNKCLEGELFFACSQWLEHNQIDRY